MVCELYCALENTVSAVYVKACACCNCDQGILDLSVLDAHEYIIESVRCLRTGIAGFEKAWSVLLIIIQYSPLGLNNRVNT